MSLSFVFPGQGSQHLGMLQPFANEAPVKQCFAEAQEVLQQDLWQLSMEGPEEDLNNTLNTQPLLLTAGVGLWRLWRERGGAAPQHMAGHSLGEYTALVCSDSLDFAAALTLVRSRAKYMQLAMEQTEQGEGAMAAILGLDHHTVKQLCDEASAASYVYPANINSPKQIVISGYAAGVEAASAAAKEAGAKRAVVLPVSVPSHCALMQPAAELLAADLAEIEIAPPKIPVVHNVDAAPCQDPAAIKDKLVQQLTKSVQWVDSVNYICAHESATFVECGPKKVLCSLIKSINPDTTSHPLGQSMAEFTAALEAVN